MRDKRKHDQFREIRFANRYNPKVPGSCLVQQGNTKILCTATFSDRIPFFLKEQDSPTGWITAEYSLLPGSTGNNRIPRERLKSNHRNIEIQRFISRSLRNTIDLSKIGRRTITIDCDVLEADGSTRCVSFNGALLSLAQCLRHMVYEHLIRDLPPILFSSAVSVGITGKDILLDLDYQEDSTADSDISVVSSRDERILEVQTHVERNPLDPKLLNQAVQLALLRNKEIIAMMEESLR